MVFLYLISKKLIEYNVNYYVLFSIFIIAYYARKSKEKK